MLSNEKWFGASPPFYDETIDQSLRFNRASSSYLRRTGISSAGTNQKKLTASVWLKVTQNTSSSLYNIISQGSDNNNRSVIYFYNSQFRYDHIVSGTNNTIVFSPLLRDFTNFYHIAVTVDMTQSSNADKVHFYLNGVRQPITSSSYVATNTNTYFNGTNDVSVGTGSTIASLYDGYMAEVNMLDGITVGATQDSNGDYIIDEFGEMKNGVWIPKAYSGSYGTNGFRLTFGNSSNIGEDSAGSNDFGTVSNIDANDIVPDSPTNNFCTYNNLYSWATTNTTLSEGNLKSTETGTTFGVKGIGTIAVNSGKWYFETHPYLMGNANYANIGVIDVSEMTTTTGTGSDTGKFKAICYASYQGRKSAYDTGVDSNITLDGLGQSAYGDSWGATDIIGVALDIDNDAIYFSKNGTWQNSATSAEISAGTTTNSAYTGKLSGLTWTVAQGNGLNAYNFGFTLNAGQDPSFAGYLTGADIGTETPSEGAGVFKYAPPTGFLALCSSNLSDTTLSPNQSEQADDYFNTVIWTGDGSSPRDITGVGFKPDWIWDKARSGATNMSHVLYDSTRGVYQILSTDQTSAESTLSTGTSAFLDDGFTVNAFSNASSQTRVAWNWKANGGTTSSNTDGSITSTVQASTEAGFSIVTYTGTGSNATVGHGLGVAPDFIIIKNRTNGSRNWKVYTSERGATKQLNLNLNIAETTETPPFNDTEPTTTVFSIGTNVDTNESSANYVAYVFAEVEGYSKFGSYTGNGSADGTFVYTGFRPAFVMVKNASVAQSWRIWDTTRNPTNETNLYLTPNGNGVEGSTSVSIDILSNGFKPRGTNASMNGSGNTMIYMAFAEQPFKFSNAR